MALNFPPSPVPGEVFTAEGVTFVWDGTVWSTPGAAFPWATVVDGARGQRTDVVLTPEALDALLDTFAPPPVGPYPLPVDVTAQRAFATNYQNTTDNPLLVTILALRSGFGVGDVVFTAFVGATNPASLSLGGHGAYGDGWWVSYTFVVPAGWFYRVTNALPAASRLERWTEYRG